MKIAAVAMAALLAVADAKISNRDLKVLEARAKNGKVNKRTLMRGAKPYNAAAKRKLEEEEWEINGYYSVEFDTCISLETGNENLFDDELIAYAANGLVKSERSYITFTVCKSANCDYQSDDEKLTFITDVATYFTALAEYLPNQIKEYCEGCEENYDYCSGNLQAEGDAEEDAEEEDAEEESEDGEDRKLKRNRRKLGNNNRIVEYIDCDKCDAYECFANMENEDNRKLDEEEEYDMDGAIEWLEGLAECKELEDVAYGDTALYAGLLCNSKGDGVEIGVFMDEECSLYTTVESYSNVMTDADKEYFSMSEEFVKYTFQNQFDCEDVEVEYTNPYQENNDEEEEEEDDNGEAPEAAEYCADLFENTVNLADCNVDENEEQEDENEDGDDYVANYEWYSYEISNEDAEDAQAVCKVLNGYDTDSGKNKSWKGKTVYDESSSGTLYQYKKSKKSGSGGGGGVFLFIILLLAVAGVAFFMFNKKKNDSKRAPLINASNGQMA